MLFRSPERVNHVWSYDFVQGHTYCPWSRQWRKFRILVVIDEFSRECLALYVARTIKAVDVIDVLSDLMLERGVPEFIRSDNELNAIVVVQKEQAHPQLSKQPKNQRYVNASTSGHFHFAYRATIHHNEHKIRQ